MKFSSKQIGLIYNQLLFGKFSSQLNEYCQKNNINPPYNLCFAEDPWEHFSIFYETNPAFELIETSVDLDFEDKFFNKLLTKQIGTKSITCYCVQKIQDELIQVFGNKKNFFQYRARLFFFSVNKEFVMGEYLFKTEGNKISPDKISKLVFEKYQIEPKEINNGFYIKDKSGRILVFEDMGFNISIKILDKNNKILDKIWREIQETKESKESKIEL